MTKQKVETRGRPSVMTKEVLGKLEEAYLLGANDIQACFKAKITVQTLHNYQNKHPEFVELKERFRQNPILIALETVVAACKENPDLALRLLERRFKSDFSLRTELAGADGAELKVKIDLDHLNSILVASKEC